MSNRERIFVIVMVMAVAYGVYDLFLSSSPKTGPFDAKNEVTELDKLRKQVFVELDKEKLSGVETYIIGRAETEWLRDLFIQMKDPEKAKASGIAGEKALKPDFIYSGFVAMGSRKTAIINGMEYQAGEEVEPGGYVLRKIFPNKVIIEEKGQKQKIIVPLVEEVL